MRICLLGGLELRSPTGEVVHLATRKTRLVLAALALAGAKGITRAQLCRLFWPDRAAPQARSSLRQALTAIRRVIGEDADQARALDGDHETVRLGLPDRAIDALAFELNSKRPDPQAWVTAAGLYEGDLLAGYDLADDVEDWFAVHRRALRRSALNLVERMSKLPEAPSELLDSAEALAERLLATDGTAEEAHRALIRVHQRRGHASAALRQFEHCRAALNRELAAEPDQETSLLVAGLREQTAAPPLVQPLAPTASAPARPTAQDRDQPSIIVMPFDNLSGSSDDYFVDGVVEEITSALSRVRDFFVIARQSAFTYKGRFVDVREVGSELGVSYVVEGTVRRGGDRLRISVQLVNAATRQQLWSDRYEGSNADVFAFQDQIAAKVAGAIHPAVRRAEIELARLKPPTDLRAYDLLMRAYPKLWGQNAEAVREAVATLEQAVAIEPNYGRAHALLAWCHALNITYLWASDPELEERASMECVGRASRSIDDDPTALTACGATLSLLGDQTRAEALLQSALELDPNNAWAWTRLGWVGIYRDQPLLAKERFERAMALSPLDPFGFNMRMGFAAALAMAGRLDDAVAIARDVVAKNPQVTWVYRLLTGWAGMAGDLATARWAADRLLAVHPDYTVTKYLSVPALRSIPSWRDAMAVAMRQAGIPEN